MGGGFHHAFADHGEGFCLLNDVAIAVATLLAEGATERIAVVDLDVHHGNGTAAIFADEPRVFTFSMYHQWNYPALKPPGDLDVGLEDGVGDEGVPGTPTGAPTPYSWKNSGRSSSCIWPEPTRTKPISWGGWRSHWRA